MILTIASKADLQAHLDAIEDATVRAMSAIGAISSPREALRRMKFDALGAHPISGHPLNLIEQVNQTFTYLVALKATEWLLDRHPEACGFKLAPGATMALELDIMSIAPNLVGAETFAAVHPANNRKLEKDLRKLAVSSQAHRYAFFFSPNFPPGRIERLERNTGVEVHCIEI